MPPGPWIPTTFPQITAGKIFVEMFVFPLPGPGSMTLVRGLGLNKPHNVPIASLALNPIQWRLVKSSTTFLEGGAGETVLRNKLEEFVTRHQPSTQMQRAYASVAQGMRCHFKEWSPPHNPPHQLPSVPYCFKYSSTDLVISREKSELYFRLQKACSQES